jgi:hypothetical protein
MRAFLALAAAGLSLLILTGTAAAAPPTITYTIEGIVGTNGWYRGSAYGDNVVLHWMVSGETDTNCVLATTVPGPTTGTTRSCWASNSDGTTTVQTNPPIKIDNTPPSGVGFQFSRGADYHGWYNHRVGIVWGGSDATSGIAGCTSVTYAGPEGPGLAVPGGCTDVAGNSTAVPATIAYDATPPALSGLGVTSTATADVVHWTTSTPADNVVVRRSPRGSRRHVTVFRGSGSSRAVDRGIRPGVEYEYAIQSVDQAGNASPAMTIAGLPKVLVLGATSYVPHAAPQPILRRRRVRGVRYYHVQLFRGSKRILAAWPQTHALGLPAAWRWAGRRHRLAPGRYRWYVWAGLGARALAHYRTIGSAQFIVPR